MGSTEGWLECCFTFLHEIYYISSVKMITGKKLQLCWNTVVSGYFLFIVKGVSLGMGMFQIP